MRQCDAQWSWFWYVGNFIENAFVPDFVEGLAHVQKDGDSLMVSVDGVSELRNNSDKLKSGRKLPAEAELFLPDEIIQQGSNPAMQEALEHLR